MVLLESKTRGYQVLRHEMGFKRSRPCDLIMMTGNLVIPKYVSQTRHIIVI